MKSLVILMTLLVTSLCVRSQTGTEIMLYKMKWTKGELSLTSGENITQHKGYDNQPYFHPQKPEILYSSFDDSGRSDIKIYDIKNRVRRNFTSTRDREYSPTVVPDGKYVSCILQRDNGAQDLIKYPIDGGEPTVLISHLKVGYHSWYNNDQVLLFVLEEKDGSSLRLFTISTGKDSVLATNIGRSLHRIPETKLMSFIRKGKDGDNTIMSIDMSSLSISEMTKTLPGQDHLCWLNKKVVLMSDGKSQVFWKKIAEDSKWKAIRIDTTNTEISLKGISRLAVNPKNNALAVVINE